MAKTERKKLNTGGFCTLVWAEAKFHRIMKSSL